MILVVHDYRHFGTQLLSMDGFGDERALASRNQQERIFFVGLNVQIDEWGVSDAFVAH